MVMEDGNRVTDKVIRRVSSRSRRIALRARRETGNSSSESEQDTQSPKVLRKTASSEHGKTLNAGNGVASISVNSINSNSSGCSNSNKILLQKYAHRSSADLIQRQDNFRFFSALIGICHLNISFFHLWLAAYIYNLQKNFSLLTRTIRQQQHQQQIVSETVKKTLSTCNNNANQRQMAGGNSDRTIRASTTTIDTDFANANAAIEQNITSDTCKSIMPLNSSLVRCTVRNGKQENNENDDLQTKLPPLLLSSQLSSSPSTTTTAQLLSSSEQQKLNNYVDDLNTGESEDADYVSDDHSTYSRPNKSNTELDVSMDESLAESSGRESGYLSGIDASFLNRSFTSSTSPPTVSPHSIVIALNQRNDIVNYTGCINNNSSNSSTKNYTANKQSSEVFSLHSLKPDVDVEADVDEDDEDDDDNNIKSATKRKNVASIQINTKIPSSTSTSSLASVILSPQQTSSFLLSYKTDKKLIDIDIDTAVPDYVITENLLKSSIIETKYVTAIFEMTVGGIDELVADVNNELNMWFNSELGLMGIACEIQWSVPEKYRNRLLEMRMKSALHASLRENNLRVLNMKNSCGIYMPLTLTAAVTQENCGRDQKLKSFQGIYRRFYESLLPYQHKETGEWHSGYWKLDTDNLRSLPTPKPQQFIFGNNPTELDRGSLIALNVIALKVATATSEKMNR